ncbi:ArsR family transcriptional regulator [Nonomuraea sp. NPDC049486]|uniref:helix-turn-helix transcriptional regulator n=1 Tax=Nonomuraea sp. NPDC049486 TaxID=3155773 RepID=UPI00343C0539
MTGLDRARAHEVLSVPSRVTILDLLRERAEPLDARELAAGTGLHVTTVRFHLSALLEAGLVVERAERSGGRGRPRAVYSASWAAEPEHGPYQELAELLARHFADTPAQRARRAERAGEEWALRRLSPAATPAVKRDGRSAEDARSAVKGDARSVEDARSGVKGDARSEVKGDARSAVTAMFAEMGFDPEPTGDGRILLHGCPFRATARSHPEVVCAAHRGLLRSAVELLDPGAPGLELHAFVRPELCVITAGGDAPEPHGTSR